MIQFKAFNKRCNSIASSNNLFFCNGLSSGSICCWNFIVFIYATIDKFFWNFERIICPVIEVKISSNTLWNVIFRKECFWNWGNLSPWCSIKWNCNISSEFINNRIPYWMKIFSSINRWNWEWVSSSVSLWICIVYSWCCMKWLMDITCIMK